jgi:hypothetical protein
MVALDTISPFNPDSQNLGARKESTWSVLPSRERVSRTCRVLTFVEEYISMLKTTLIPVMAVLMAAFGSEARAQTQPPPASLGFVNVNFGTQPSSHTVGRSASFPIYGETATLTTAQENGDGAVVDIAGGYRFLGNLGAAIGFSNFRNTSDGGVVVTVPDPLITDRPVTVNTSVTDMDHSERGIHLQAVWFMPITNQIDIALSAGPSFIRVSQDLVATVTIPAGTQAVTPIVSTEKKTAIGVNVGVDGSYLFTRNFGAGIFIRYAGGKVDLPSVPDLRVGGLQAGVGARVRF